MMRSVLTATLAIAGLMLAQLSVSSEVAPVGDREALSVVGGQAATSCPSWGCTTQACGSVVCPGTSTTVACPANPFWIPGKGSTGNAVRLTVVCAVCGTGGGGTTTCGAFNCIAGITPCCN